METEPTYNVHILTHSIKINYKFENFNKQILLVDRKSFFSIL